MANSNKRFNTIDSLLIDGSLSSNPVAIREHADNFYESMFAKSLSWRPKLDDLEFHSLSASEASSLEASFLEREVKDVIFGMDGRAGWLLFGLLPSLFGCTERGHHGGLL